MTELKNFIVSNKDRDDMIGDLCHDLVEDDVFIFLGSEEQQRSYIIRIGMLDHDTQDVITELLKEYSGETIPDFDC